MRVRRERAVKLTRVSEGWTRVPGFPLTAGRPLYSELVDITLHITHKPRHLVSPRSRGFRHPPSRGSGSPRFALLLVCRASHDGRCGRFPRCWCRFLRCCLSSSPASPGSIGSECVDGTAEVSPGGGGDIGSCRLPSPRGRARSPWSPNRARTRGLSIVLGSSVRPDSTRRGHVSSSFASSDS